MHPTDDELIARVDANGLSMGQLFLIGGQIYTSLDAGDFSATSTFAPYESVSSDEKEGLISLLRRLAAPEYDSIAQLDDEICQFKEWEALYTSLMEVLRRHGTHDPFGDGDFYLIDDYYSSAQHKNECTSADGYTSVLASDVQELLSRYSRRWVVIFALPAVEGKDHAFLVYANEIVEYAG